MRQQGASAAHGRFSFPTALLLFTYYSTDWCIALHLFPTATAGFTARIRGPTGLQQRRRWSSLCRSILDSAAAPEVSSTERSPAHRSSSTLSSSSRPVPTAPTGIYVHIPFCRRRCRYCDFAIVPVGKDGGDANVHATSGRSQLVRSYTDALVQEILLDAEREKKKDDEGAQVARRPTVSSVYFGGGTPSLAPTESLAAVVRAVRQRFEGRMDPQAEWTIEMDPGTFDLSKLREIRSLGFNRVSLGVQSFDDRILRGLGRQHTSRDVYEAAELLRNVYGPDVNLSIDLISGVPGLTMAKWAHTLERTTALHPQHLSVYDLQIEAGTVFGSWYGDRSDRDVGSDTLGAHQTATRHPLLRLPNDDEAADMYRYAAGYLRSKGYEHYEVSSYAACAARAREDVSGGRSRLDLTPAQAKMKKQGPFPPSPFRSRHNQVYWHERGEWHAFGLGATSRLEGSLVRRPRALSDYVRWVHLGLPTTTASDATVRDSKGDDAPVFLNDSRARAEVSVESPLDRALHAVLKRLRTRDGLDLQWMHDEFGPEYCAAVLDGAAPALELRLAETVAAASLSSSVSRGNYPGTTTTVLRLTDPDGFLVSNSVLSNIFLSLEALDPSR